MTERFKRWKSPEIKEGKLTKYNWMVDHVKNLKLGYKTDIGAFTYINARYGVEIEDLVQIGSHCSIYSISTIDNKAGRIKLKKDCRIGSHSVIMPGVTIGKNSIIGAFSFVNKDIPANVMALGIPAKIVKRTKGKKKL
jgi:acetyltransferase-like isoleucine patch superfamily enzyme